MTSLCFPLLVRHQAAGSYTITGKHIFKLTFAFLDGKEDTEDFNLNAINYFLN